jgi:hypothetical protein
MKLMRITISHERTKAEVMQSVDRSLNDILHGPSGLPIKLTIERRNWEGSTLTFAATAKIAFMSTPIKGTVEVTDHDLTVDADLGMLNKLIPENAARDLIGSRIKGLLK